MWSIGKIMENALNSIYSNRFHFEYSLWIYSFHESSLLNPNSKHINRRLLKKYVTR